jgi:hypothetical protein
VGHFGGYTQKTKYENGTTPGSKGLNISPVVGKFIEDNLVVGSSLSFIISNAENDQGFENKSNGYGAGALLGNISQLVMPVSMFSCKED